MTHPTTEATRYLDLQLNLQGRLALFASLGLLVLLSCDAGVPSLEGAALFTEAEMNDDTVPSVGSSALSC